MHLWPSLAIRDSFKDSYLRNFEWNLNRMKREKQSRTVHQNLLSSEGDGARMNQSTCDNSGFFRDALMVLSCFYCCFCFGGGDDE